MEHDEAREQWERIEAYLNGQLLVEERAAFEQEIRLNSILAEAVEKTKLGRLALRHYGLRNQIRSIHTQAMRSRDNDSRADGQTFQEPLQAFSSPQTDTFSSADHRPKNDPIVVPLWKLASRVAAGVTILLLCVVGIRVATLSNDNLAQVEERLYVSESTRGEAEDATHQQMNLAYQKSDYAQCARLYEEKGLAAQPGHLEEDFLAGNAYLGLNKPAQAETCFRKVLTTNEQAEEKQFEEEAEYYLALSLLKQNKLAEAQTLFARIRQNPDHRYHSKVDGWFYQQLQWLRWKHK